MLPSFGSDPAGPVCAQVADFVDNERLGLRIPPICVADLAAAGAAQLSCEGLVCLSIDGILPILVGHKYNSTSVLVTGSSILPM